MVCERFTWEGDKVAGVGTTFPAGMERTLPSANSRTKGKEGLAALLVHQLTYRRQRIPVGRRERLGEGCLVQALSPNRYSVLSILKRDCPSGNATAVGC